MTRRLPIDAVGYYLGLGPGRSYAAVAAKFGVSKRAVGKRAAQEKWQERVDEFERKARETAEQKALESIEAMNERHLKSARVIQGKALEALRAVTFDSAMDAARALDLGMKAERLVRGEPSDRTAISVEDAIRREAERWMPEVIEDGVDAEPAKGGSDGDGNAAPA